MADEVAQEMNVLEPFLDHILNPKITESLRTTIPDGTVSILVYENAVPRPMTLRGIFPFMTVYDLKLAIFVAMKLAPKAIPEQTFLGRQLPGPASQKKYSPLDYMISFPANPTETIGLYNPYSLKEVDSRFVSSAGEQRIVGITERDRMTLEDLLTISVDKRLPTFHVFFLEDLLNAYKGPQPMSELEWNGKFHPYFTHVSQRSMQPTKEQVERVRKFAKSYIRRQQLYLKLEASLDAGDPLLPLTATGIRYLRLTYTKPQQIPGIDALFYEAPVNGRRPYMRLMPAEGTAISKVHMLSDTQPDVQEPRLLIQWSQERSPTPERNFALAKILLRTGSVGGGISPLYITLRLFDDGTADVTIEPPKGVRKLDPRSELDSLYRVLREGLESFPYLRQLPALANGMYVFGLHLRGGTAYTQTSLREKLPVFSSVFQEIAPLPGERPLLMLRYKLISNFMTEDRVQTFITQVMSRKLVRGETVLQDLIEVVADEFQMDLTEARKKVAEKLQSSGDVIMANTDMKEYALNMNPGIDIAVFAQHPLYSFHVYRVSSYETLQRILTFLSMLFSRSAAELAVDPTVVRDIMEAEELKVEESDGEEAEPEAEPEQEQLIEESKEEDAYVPQVEQAADVGDSEAYPDYLGDLMFTGEEEGEAEGAELEGAAAVEKEGAALPEPPLQAKGRVQEEGTEAVNTFKEELRRDGSLVAEDAASLEAAGLSAKADAESPVAQTVPKKFTFKKPAPVAQTVPKKFTFKKPAPVAPREAEEDTTGQEKGFETFFSNKLKEADNRLFDFHRTHPSLKKYVSQCGSNLMRQPAVISPDKYESMLAEYKKEIDDGIVNFYVFPLDKDKKKEPYTPDTVKKEYYTLMRYGTSEKNENYYLCCKYFCTRDEILVREVDLNSDVLRHPIKQSDGTMRTKKPRGTCPFCEGKVIQNRRFPGVNETVLLRNVKAGTVDSRHLFIRFLKKTNHPEGFYLPCCFLEDQPIRIGHPAFPEPSEDVYAAASSSALKESKEEEEGEEVVEEGAGEADLVRYEDEFLHAKYAYIVGSEKLPLEGAELKFQKIKSETEEPPEPKVSRPQIGLLPAQLNTYFAQDSTDLVSRTFNPQKLKPNSEGFLRIGVENKSRFKADSFLAAVAPFFRRNSAQKMKELLEDIVQPRLFLALNFGNLALEMYNPVRPRPSKEILKLWARTNLKIRKMSTNNEELVMRAYLSYQEFRVWLSSSKTQKDYRHFAHLFMQPGLLETGVKKVAESGVILTEHRRPGVLFIVLDLLKTGELKIRCPPYPVSKEMFARSDIGFLFHHYSGIWEPIFYVDTRGGKDVSLYNILFSAGVHTRWPKIVKERVQEFSSQCSSATGGRGIFTSQTGISSTKMIGITSLKAHMSKDEDIQLYGMIRDTYNHVAGLVYTRTGGAPMYVAIPVVEDGVADITSRLILDWDDFDPAPLTEVLTFYEEHIVPRYPAYRIERLVKSQGTGSIVAVQLKNGLYVPISSAEDEAAAAKLPDQTPAEVTEMEWTLNRKITMEASGAVPGESEQLKIKEFNEVYEHLRLTFSNWLAAVENGAEIRKVMESIIFRRDIPLFEKRRRMEIILAPQVESWIGESDEDKPRQASLLRVDCRLRPESECGGACSWSQEKGKCLIHSPAKDPHHTSTSAIHVLLLRLIEELLRFGQKRQQIFDQQVSQLASLDNPIRVGDQYIIPEKSMVWTEMLRLEWAKDVTEKPIFLEEMSGALTASSPAPALDEVSSLNATLQTVMGADDPATGLLRLYPSPGRGFLPFLQLLNIESDVPDIEGEELSDTTLTTLLRKSGMPIVQIDLRVDPPGILAKKPPRDKGLGFPVFVLRKGLPPSLLCRDPENPALLHTGELPKGLQTLIEGAKTIFIPRATA